MKKITLALGQKNSFSRGFDKILHMLLVGLMSLASFIVSRKQILMFAMLMASGKFTGKLSCHSCQGIKSCKY